MDPRLSLYDRRLDNMTLKEIFGECEAHLLKQNAKSCIGEVCAYRGNNGLKCAAGIFLSDENAEKLDSMQGFAWDCELISAGLSVDKTNLIRDLQSIHDREPVSEWRGLLQGWRGLLQGYQSTRRSYL